MSSNVTSFTENAASNENFKDEVETKGENHLLYTSRIYNDSV